MRTAPALLCLLALSSGALAQGSFKLTPVTEGAMKKIGYYSPLKVTLSSEKPASAKKVPADLEAPLYAEIAIGGAKTLVLIDEPDGKPARLFVDANNNGDLTDDPPAEWTGKKSKARPAPKKEGDDAAAPAEEPKEYMQYSGGATLHLAQGKEKLDAHISMYRFDKTDPARALNKDSLLYYRDYAYEGEVKLGGKTYKAILADENASGDFRGKDGEKSGVMLLIDVNGNGKFENRGERFDIHKPFNIDGTTYEVAGMTALGSEFKIIKSSKKVAAEEPSPDLGAGKKIQAFAAKDMEGKAVKFPEDYKGKIVMLDFWATWCGPCMGEVPGLVKAYESHHGEGFEILGVTLDQKDQAKKVKDVTGAKGMTWRQIYDGGYWKAEIAVKFDIHSIPAAFLVDGDTGVILASGTQLRGDELDATIRKAIAKKKGAQ